MLGALFTFPDQEPPNRDLPFDRWGIALGFAAPVLLFAASAELSGGGFDSFAFLVPAAAGILCFIALLLVEYHEREPLAPVKLVCSTYPVVGMLVASVGGGAFVTLLELAIDLLRKVGHKAPLGTGIAFWPQVVGVLIAAALLGLLIRTRGLPLLILGGMVALIAGGTMLLGVDPARPGALMLFAVGLMGVGAGATVSPGLYLAGFSLPSPMIGRVFALVELVRAVADYMLAPLMRQVARVGQESTASILGGLHEAIWITLLIAGEFTLLGPALYLAGGSLPRPDLRGWLQQEKPAIRSPPLAAQFRPAVTPSGRSAARPSRLE